MPVGRKTFAVLGVLCVFVLALGALVGCGGSEEEGEQGEKEPEQESAEEKVSGKAGASDVVVRVSGTQGTSYSGTYGTARKVQTVSATTLGSEPTDYELGVIEEEAGVVNATFTKGEPGRETLRVEVLVDGEVVTTSETTAELGSVIVNWAPPEARPEESRLPKEKEREFDKDPSR
jgi:hypothetical protein